MLLLEPEPAASVGSSGIVSGDGTLMAKEENNNVSKHAQKDKQKITDEKFSYNQIDHV